MTPQLSIFDQPPSQPTPTSVDAARRIASQAPSLRLQVLALIHEAPRTDEEIADCLGLNPSTARPRRIELVKAGLVRDSGMQRLTRANRWAVVWDVTP